MLSKQPTTRRRQTASPAPDPAVAATSDRLNRSAPKNASKNAPKSCSALDNPFATRHVAPGEIPYFFPAEDDLQKLIARADSASWTGQIVGPHGSGKTTLIRHLSRQLQQRFAHVEFLIIRGVREVQICQRLLSTSPAPASEVGDGDGLGNALLVIDGVERLSWLQRMLLVADCRRKRIGLLVTTHRAISGMPVFYQTSFDRTRFCRILHHLGTQQYEDHYKKLRNQFGDNCREMLFRLYDEHV